MEAAEVTLFKGELVSVKEESSGVKQEDPQPVIELMEAVWGTLFKEEIKSVIEDFVGVSKGTITHGDFSLKF